MCPPIPQVACRVLTEWSKDIAFVSTQLETWSRDADDCVTLIIKNDGQTDRARVSTEAPLPQTVAQDDYRRASGPVLFRQEGASLQ